MEQQIAEIVPFLSLSHRPEVRIQALQIVEGLTATAGLETLLISHGAVPFLVRMVGDETFNQRALNSLINLFGCSHEARQKALEVEVVERLMDLLRTSKANTELAVMALVNITVEQSACTVLLQEGSKVQGLYLRRLMQFWTDTMVPDVLVNVAQNPTGRDLLMQPAMELLSNISKDLASSDPTRRRPVLRLVHNLAFEINNHDELLSEQILVPLLLPLVGPEPMQEKDICGMLPQISAAITSDKKRDPDRESRMLTIQIFGMFLKIHKSRKYLKQIQLYPILRDLHLSEDERDEDMTGAIEELIPYLVADDPLDRPKAKIEEISDE